MFFIDGRKWLVSVTVTTAPQLAVSEAKPILDMNPYFTNDGAGRPYDVSLDSQRFLVLKDASDPAKRPQAIAVLNWLDELKRLVP